MIRLIVAFVVALILALLLSTVAFAAITTPHTRFPGPLPLQRSLIYLDAVPSVANRLLPDSLRSHMTVLLRCDHTYCFPQPLPVERARYIRNAAPAYLLLLYLPVALGAAWRER